jgi:hypothetical protein
MTTDENYIDGMKDEHAELLKKLRKLDTMIYVYPLFNELKRADQARLIKQAGFMKAYADVLESRIWVALAN